MNFDLTQAFASLRGMASGFFALLPYLVVAAITRRFFDQGSGDLRSA